MSYANQGCQTSQLGMAAETACEERRPACQIARHETSRATPEPSRDIQRLIEIMAALRTPGTGCPWDLKQDFSTIAPYTIEEAHEVADAIARDDLDDLKDELGDLLLQVVFHARMAQEQCRVRFRRRGPVDHREADPAASACVRRYAELTPDQVKGLWDRIKAQEKAERAQGGAER